MVAVRGRHLTRGLACAVDGVPAAALLLSPTAALCRLPPHPPGPATVTVTDGAAALAMTFAFAERPRIASPTDAPAPGTLLTLRGAHLANGPGLACRFGDVVVPASLTGPTGSFESSSPLGAVSCVVPEGLAGTVDVAVTVDGLTFSAPVPVALAARSPLELAMSPRSGPAGMRVHFSGPSLDPSLGPALGPSLGPVFGTCCRAFDIRGRTRGWTRWPANEGSNGRAHVKGYGRRHGEADGLRGFSSRPRRPAPLLPRV